MEEDDGMLSAGFAIDTQGAFSELTRFYQFFDAGTIKVLDEMRKVEVATGGMMKLGGATREVAAFSAAAKGELTSVRQTAETIASSVGGLSAAISVTGAAASREARALAREKTLTATAGEALIRTLEREAMALGKTKEEMRAAKIEAIALSANQQGNTDLADRLLAAARQRKFAADSVAEAEEEAGRKVAASAAQQEQALRSAAFAHDQFEAAARRGVSAMREQDAAAERDAASLAQLRAMIDPAATAQERLNREIAEARRVMTAAGASAAELGLAEKMLGDRAESAAQRHDMMAGSARKSGFALQTVALQLPDITQGLLTGQKPMTVFIQQGFQIVQVGMMAEGGLRGFGKELGALALRFSPLLIGLAAAGAGFALFNRWINEGVKNEQLTSGLGKITGGADATKQELFKLKDATITWADTSSALFTVVGKDVAAVFVGDMKTMGKDVKSVLDDLTSYGRQALAGLYAGVAGMKAYLGEVEKGGVLGIGKMLIGQGDPKLIEKTFGAQYDIADKYLTKLGGRVRTEAIKNARERNAKTIGFNNEPKPKTDQHAASLARDAEATEAQIRNLYKLADAYGVSGAAALIADLRATPANWIADDDIASLSILGLYKDFEIDLPYPPVSYCTLTIEGLAQGDSYVDAVTDPAPAGKVSTLQMLRPIAVTDAVLTASSVAEDDAEEWTAGKTYAIGARVIRAATHRVYESASAANVGHDPASASGDWLDVGPTIRWAMFDKALGTVTSASTAIVLTLKPGAFVNGLAILDTNAASVRVQAPGYDRTLVPADGAGTVLFLDLSADDAASITVTLTPAPATAVPRPWDDDSHWSDYSVWRDTIGSADGTVSVGTLLIGRVNGLGITEASPTAGITDYSRKDVDDFGEVSIVPRAWAKRMTAKSLIRSDAVDQVAGCIATVRGQPALWLGDARLDSLTVYGFFKDFAIEIGQSVSKLSLTIEGLSKAAPAAPAAPALGSSVVAQGSADGINWHLGLQTGDVFMRISNDGGKTYGSKVRIAGEKAPLVIVQWSIDGTTAWHPNFFGADIYFRQSNDGGVTFGPAIKAVGEDGDIGPDGTSAVHIFRQSAVVPETPVRDTGNPPPSWFDGPPAGTDYLWMSTATYRDIAQVTAWSTPQRISGEDGAKAPLIKTQWSINGVDNWHDNFFGADVYQRQSNDNGVTYGPAVRVVGEGGDDGISPSQVFTRSATVPPAPANNTGNPPAGWSDGPPAGTDFIWQSSAKFQGSSQLSTWTQPQRISGADGATMDSSVVATSFAANFDGSLKSGQLSQTVKFTMRFGDVDVSGNTTWSLIASGCTATITLNGLTAFSSVSGSGYIEASAVYAGKTYTKRVPTQILKDAPPPQTSYSQSSSVTVNSLANTSYASTPFPVVTITPNAAGQVTAIISLNYTVDAYTGGTKTFNVEAKAAYRAAGSNIWVDFAAGAVTGAPSVFTPQDRDAGGLNATQMQGGLSNQMTYDVGLYLRMVGSSPGIAGNVTGSFTGGSQ